MVKSKKQSLDYVLTIVILGLLAFGCIMVHSAGCYQSKLYYNNEYYFLYKQLLGVFLGVIAMLALSFFDYRKLIKLRYVIFIVSIVLLILVFVPGIGVENYGAKRWIKFPLFTLQSSEISKVGFVIFSSAYMAKHYEKMTTFKGLLPVLISGGIICFLIILEPNMSITMCVAIVMFCMLFIGGARIKHFVCIGAPALLAVPALIIAEPYRMKRLLAFINPWESPLEEGYQLVQSYYSLGSGGVFGVGLFNSRQKYLFLPFAESDFILSIIGEELGWLGCVILIFAYVLVVSRAFKIAKNASDRFGAYLAYGIGCLISVQVIINIAVVSGSIPPTGLPLPFISSGTSSIIAFCCAIGILNSVKRYGDEWVRTSFMYTYARKTVKT
ncbi:MAG: putative lipid II flippase FtsW [Clostridiales bacterium]|nr:putative lipid II flippase FtsW [Clostridiales bacterium]